MLDVVHIRENESFLDIKPTCNDILSVFIGKSVAFFELEILLEQEFLVVSELNDKRAVEGVL